MSDSAESVVRKFLAAWADPNPDELGGFFADDAVWVDGPQGARRGADAIKSELAAQLGVSAGATVDVRSLLTDGRTVMAEYVSTFSVGGSPISSVVMAVFELRTDGRIKQWREAYDLKSVTDQIEAARFNVPT